MTTLKPTNYTAIAWPGDLCISQTTAHYFVEAAIYNGLILFICKRCMRFKLLPASTVDAERLSTLLRRYGSADGYWKFLESCTGHIAILDNLQALWQRRKHYGTDGEFVIAATTRLALHKIGRPQLNSIRWQQ